MKAVGPADLRADLVMEAEAAAWLTPCAHSLVFMGPVLCYGNELTAPQHKRTIPLSLNASTHWRVAGISVSELWKSPIHLQGICKCVESRQNFRFIRNEDVVVCMGDANDICSRVP